MDKGKTGLTGANELPRSDSGLSLSSWPNKKMHVWRLAIHDRDKPLSLRGS